jgi:broad specificity phosphatase PhoE
MSIVLVRHGQTEPNRAGQLLGRRDASLTDLGLRQASAAAEAVMAAHDIAYVVSSPLERAMETAAMFGCSVGVDERWIEVDYGEYEGLSFREVPDELWRQWRADPAWAPPSGESLTSVGRRVRAACEDLSADAIEADVVVVSHVSPIKAAIAWALEVGDEVSWRMRLDVAAVCEITCGERGPSLRLFNQTAHLAGLAP